MSDPFEKIVGLLGLWGSVAITVAGLVKWAISFQSNKKTVKEMKAELTEVVSELEDIKENQEDFEDRVDRAIDRLMDRIDAMNRR